MLEESVLQANAEGIRKVLSTLLTNSNVRKGAATEATLAYGLRTGPAWTVLYPAQLRMQ